MSRKCHLVTDDDQVRPSGSSSQTDSAAAERLLCFQCEGCEEGCSRPRPPGCPHSCPRPCHPGDCPPCNQMIRQRCHLRTDTHCSVMSERRVTIKFYDRLQELGCGHRCKQVCHPGVCEETCHQKVKLRCSCRRIRKEVPCSLSSQSSPQCDDVCREQRQRLSQVKTHLHAEHGSPPQEELEAFEKRQQRGGRRNKRRRREEVDDEQERAARWRRRVLVVLVPLGGVLLSAAFYYLLSPA
uniref:NF-X1-type domain-containing protein n=1 Tax=Oryzias latipes TaxID=8090 RepID=A0A3B3I263_ORYLA